MNFKWYKKYVDEYNDIKFLEKLERAGVTPERIKMSNSCIYYYANGDPLKYD